MGFLPQFKTDVFLSYRRVSNGEVIGGDRWVDSFRQHLQEQLSDRVGDVHLWRDKEKLVAGEDWRRDIVNAVESSGIFLALINATYFDSDECRKEMNLFLQQLKAGNNGDGRKLVPVFKHPSPNPEKMPAELRGRTQHREFFVQTNEDLQVLDHTSEDYWKRMSRVVQDIEVALRHLQGEQQKRARGKVFIACACPELKEKREELRSDLRSQGFMVVPENEYWWSDDNVVQCINDDLAGALLAVHLVSRNERDPAIPYHEHDRLQLELAYAGMKRGGKSSVLVWMPETAQTAASKQALVQYIGDTVANEADGVEVLENGFDELTEEVFSKLPKPAPPKPAAAPAARRDVAVLVEEDDEGDAGPLLKLLAHTLKVEPRQVDFADTGPCEPERLQRELDRCEQLVIFWSRKSKHWMRDLLDLPALQTLLDENRACIVVSGADLEKKSNFATTKARLVKDLPGEAEPGLRAFFDAWQGSPA